MLDLDLVVSNVDIDLAALGSEAVQTLVFCIARDGAHVSPNEECLVELPASKMLEKLPVHVSRAFAGANEVGEKNLDLELVQRLHVLKGRFMDKFSDDPFFGVQSLILFTAFRACI